ncbi:HNH endonuclease signature motif containing protein [Prevotella sp. lc2012]|uniref:HNH endonuclease signature motif containing protein n=1 Tax=Prevotella sp. lc2012 TaxID=1761886 RepID=UPI000898B98E|nr:HNH endonuclease signature motif containing protein [Prevotella sp. lc2012]SEE30191.1 HNH endonuclease [Prevotella sp. lc2012]
MVYIDDYNEVKDCIYKEEHYSARDNGAVMRHPREGKRIRKDDNVWTFGKPNDKTGYMEIAGQRVHRIVAFAFHGNPPTNQHVVDHIDTNRRNNRPENLRWLTRLENALNNPITRARIENLCGSIEEFLADPSILRGHERIDPNFSWMRAVTPEEARASLERLTNWAKEHPKPQGGSLGEWVFQEKTANAVPRYNAPSFLNMKQGDITASQENQEEKKEPLKTQSLTPNAIQLDWKNPVAFPCCPQEFSGNPLEVYMANLKEGAIFSTNNYGNNSTVLQFGMPQPDCLWVMCRISIGFKTHAYTKITYKDAIFYHENMGVFDIGDNPEEIFESILKGDTE